MVESDTASARLRQAVGDHLFDRRLAWELAGAELRVDQFAVEADLEAPAAGRDQLQVVDLLLERGQELGRQTDGLRLVASDRAVRQLDVHAGPPRESDTRIVGDGRGPQAGV